MALAEVKGVQAGPGEKAFGFLEVGTTSVSTYRIPVAVLNGVEPGRARATAHSLSTDPPSSAHSTS